MKSPMTTYQYRNNTIKHRTRVKKVKLKGIKHINMNTSEPYGVLLSYVSSEKASNHSDLLQSCVNYQPFPVDLVLSYKYTLY